MQENSNRNVARRVDERSHQLAGLQSQLFGRIGREWKESSAKAYYHQLHLYNLSRFKHYNNDCGVHPWCTCTFCSARFHLLHCCSVPRDCFYSRIFLSSSSCDKVVIDWRSIDLANLLLFSWKEVVVVTPLFKLLLIDQIWIDLFQRRRFSQFSQEPLFKLLLTFSFSFKHGLASCQWREGGKPL